MTPFLSRRNDPLPEHPCVGVVGATGLVGEVLLDVLRERGFPVSELVPLASRRSAGATVRFEGREWTVKEAVPEALEPCDLVFFAATGELSRVLAPEARDRGALVVDKSATWRLDPEVPLVIPEVNGETLGPRLVASPNCTTVGVAMVLAPLQRAVGLERVLVTTLQAASGIGRAGLEALSADPEVDGPFGPGFGRNVVPQCDLLHEDGGTAEEQKLVTESRKILGLPGLSLSATCVRVPVPVGHTGSIHVETAESLSPDEATEVLEAFPGVRVLRDPELPTPSRVAGRDEVLVGRIREARPGAGLWLWFAVDNLRKGAADQRGPDRGSLSPLILPGFASCVEAFASGVGRISARASASPCRTSTWRRARGVLRSSSTDLDFLATSCSSTQGSLVWALAAVTRATVVSLRRSTTWVGRALELVDVPLDVEPEVLGPRREQRHADHVLVLPGVADDQGAAGLVPQQAEVRGVDLGTLEDPAGGRLDVPRRPAPEGRAALLVQLVPALAVGLGLPVPPEVHAQDAEALLVEALGQRLQLGAVRPGVVDQEDGRRALLAGRGEVRARQEDLVVGLDGDLLGLGAAPAPETPGAETPGAETPGAETPGAETPGAETPGAETPGAETSGEGAARARNDGRRRGNRPGLDRGRQERGQDQGSLHGSGSELQGERRAGRRPAVRGEGLWTRLRAPRIRGRAWDLDLGRTVATSPGLASPLVPARRR